MKKTLPLPLKTAVKWLVYVFTALLCAALSTSGSSTHSRAIVVLPLCLAISVFEEEIPSAAMGGFCGLLADIAGGQLLGFTAVFLCLFCGLISALFRQFLRKNILNYLFLTVFVLLIYLYIYYFFYYRIWDFEGYETVLRSRLIPGTVKTVFWSPICYGFAKLTEFLSKDRKALEIEENNGKVDRV